MHDNQTSGQADNSKQRVPLILGLLLLLLLGGTSIYFWKKSSSTGLENARLVDEAQLLQTEKAMIEHELDSLTQSYNYLRLENEDLRGKETATAELIAQKDAAIQKIKGTNQRELKALRQQVEELRRLKIEYETLIAALTEENNQLKEENQRLLGENQELQSENTNLNSLVDDLAQKLEDQIRKTQSAKFKATSFRVELERRGDKPTIRAKKAKEISISFDLIDVPKIYQGDQHLYLAITDDKGNPIPSSKPIKTTVDAPGGSIQIEAQQVKAVSLAEAQRLNFVYELDEKLKRGNYVVAIYCNVGLLGVSKFKLT